MDRWSLVLTLAFVVVLVIALFMFIGSNKVTYYGGYGGSYVGSNISEPSVWRDGNGTYHVMYSSGNYTITHATMGSANDAWRSVGVLTIE